MDRTTLKILGIDPAPGKESVVYDGKKFLSFDYKELKRYLFAHKEPLLICWDAPLGVDVEESLTMKRVEKELRALKPPKGINVLPFATCPHWTISQYLFGLPNICGCEPKAKLITSFCASLEKLNIIEVHPALSMWLWLRDKDLNWHYKGNRVKKSEVKKRIVEIVKALSQKFREIAFPKIENDDQLDAFVAWLLGYFFIHEPTHVEFTGSTKEALLIPAV